MSINNVNIFFSPLFLGGVGVELDVMRIFQVSPQNKTIEIMSELESFLSGLGSFEIP